MQPTSKVNSTPWYLKLQVDKHLLLVAVVAVANVVVDIVSHGCRDDDNDLYSSVLHPL